MGWHRRERSPAAAIAEVFGHDQLQWIAQQAGVHADETKRGRLSELLPEIVDLPDYLEAGISRRAWKIACGGFRRAACPAAGRSRTSLRSFSGRRKMGNGQLAGRRPNSGMRWIGP